MLHFIQNEIHFTQNEISCKHPLTITAFLGLWCILWALEDLTALKICNYSCFLISNCYVIVIEKNDLYIYEFLRKTFFEYNIKVSLLHPGLRSQVNKQ